MVIVQTGLHLQTASQRLTSVCIIHALPANLSSQLVSYWAIACAFISTVPARVPQPTMLFSLLVPSALGQVRASHNCQSGHSPHWSIPNLCSPLCKQNLHLSLFIRTVWNEPV